MCAQLVDRAAPEVLAPAAPEIASTSFVARYARAALAVSGLVMFGFVVAHLAGNLLAFSGAGTFNAYARALRAIGTPLLPESGLLWLARVVLAGALLSHLASHLYVTQHPTASPPVVTAGLMPPWYATLPVALLQASGVLIAVFVIVHLAQLTFGSIHPAFIVGDAYRNTIAVLRAWPMSLAYMGATLAVGVHLLPGLWTACRALGLIQPASARFAATAVPLVALGVTLGLSAVPIAVLIGVLN